MGVARLLGIVALALGMLGAASAKTFVYISDAEDGEIDAYEMSATSGVLTPLGKTAAGKMVMPMAINPGKKILYAAVRSQPYTVISYAIDAKSGALTRAATAPLADSMSYISTDRSGRFLFAASYAGDKVTVSAINAQGLADAEANQILPTGHNAHCIRSDASNKFVFASNLGSSQILQFRFDAKTGQLTPNDPPLAKVRPDNGPRHFVLSPDGGNLYVINELSGNVGQFAVNRNAGTLTEIAYTGSVPAESGLQAGIANVPGSPASTDTTPRIWAADLQIAPNGKFLYATERTSSKIALLSVAQGSGKLTYAGNFSTETQPRGIRIDPSGKFLVASGEKSDHVAVFAIDQANGGLSLIGRYPVGKGANWIEIVEFP